MVGSVTNYAGRFAKIHGNVFASVLQRSQLTIKLALAERMNKELAAVDAKFDGKQAGRLEAEIEKLFEQKTAIGQAAADIRSALDQLNDVRTYYLAAREAAEAGDAATFDAALADVNDEVGSAVVDPTNLIGDPGPGVTAPVFRTYGRGDLQTTVQTYYLGSDYRITVGGNTLTPDHANRTLNGISFDNYTLNSLAGTAINFDDGVSGAQNGTLARRGGEVMSAWLYNDFAAGTDQDEAIADIDAAMARVSAAEDAFRLNLSVMTASINRFETRMKTLSQEFATVSTEELEAKQAERRAVTTRFDLAVNSISLTSQVSLSYVQSLFLAPPPNEKQSVFGILTGLTTLR